MLISRGTTNMITVHHVDNESPGDDVMMHLR